MSTFKRIVFWIFVFTVVIIVSVIAYFQVFINTSDPQWPLPKMANIQLELMDSTWLRYGNNWLHRNDYAVWEMYLEGSPMEIGLAHGKLTDSLMAFQEQAFVDKIVHLVPSQNYLKLLKNLIAWFNRDMERHVSKPLQEEIYGISRSAHSKFNFIGPAYHRMLNYHGAHDIGHALQNLALVGCTSFAVNLNDSAKPLLLGRNFDFYVSDDFAKNVIVCRIVPDSGFAFTYITWAGFAGVVSGMNDKGISVTINAAKSTYPTKSATPISLLAREIVQYSATIDEAIGIAKSRQLFVSESIQIGSAMENQSVIIECTPTQVEVVRSSNDKLICANHFQSKVLGNTQLNKQNMLNSPSLYRFQRTEQLLNEMNDIEPISAMAKVLRDKNGLSNKNIGMGNEKALNQLISHHSIIFEPDSLIFWISTPPFQLGPYLAYRNTDFKANFDFHLQPQIYLKNKTIEADSFLYSNDYQKFKFFRLAKAKLQTALFKGIEIPYFVTFANHFMASNPNYYYVYQLLGDYCYEQNNFTEALKYYEISLKLEIESVQNQQKIQERINIIHEKQKG